MNVTQKILNTLSSGQTLTVAQARARFNVTNVPARIDELRKEGYSIYTNTRKNSKGQKVKFYRLGKPTRSVVAAGVEYLRAQGVNVFA